jgi:hypothetical protein
MEKTVRTCVKTVGSFILAGFLAGCAWDNSPPPYHSVINYDPSRSQTFLSTNPPTNAPSTRDWKTNQVAGVGYGTVGSAAPAANTAAGEVGAASSPSGISTGAGSGTAATGAAVGATPGTAAPGAIIGNPPGTGIIGTSPSAGPASSLNQTPGTSPSVGTGLRPVTPLGTGTLPSSPPLNTFGGSGITNTGPGVTFTNTLAGPTNLLPGFSRPTP